VNRSRRSRHRGGSQANDPACVDYLLSSSVTLSSAVIKA
jgi:hypothetical protein